MEEAGGGGGGRGCPEGGSPRASARCLSQAGCRRDATCSALSVTRSPESVRARARAQHGRPLTWPPSASFPSFSKLSRSDLRRDETRRVGSNASPGNARGTFCRARARARYRFYRADREGREREGSISQRASLIATRNARVLLFSELAGRQTCPGEIKT